MLGAKRDKGQSLLEHIMLASIVIGALVVMSVFIRRGIQAAVKVAADQIGRQNEAEFREDATSGYLVNSYTSTRSRSTKTTLQRPSAADSLGYLYDDRVRQETRTLSNLGFRNTVD